MYKPSAVNDVLWLYSKAKARIVNLCKSWAFNDETSWDLPLFDLKSNINVVIVSELVCWLTHPASITEYCSASLWMSCIINCFDSGRCVTFSLGSPSSLDANTWMFGTITAWITTPIKKASTQQLGHTYWNRSSQGVTMNVYLRYQTAFLIDAF